MCRAKTDGGGRRCYFHAFGKSIQLAKDYIARKQAELDKQMLVKMKNRDVRRRIEELKTTIEKKQAHLAQKEAELATLQPPKAEAQAEVVVVRLNEEDAKRISNLEAVIDFERKDIAVMDAELTALEGIVNRDSETNRRIRQLETTIAKRKAKLAETVQKADAFRAEHGLSDEAATATPVRPLDARTERRILNEDERNDVALHLQLTENELEQLDGEAERADMTRTAFVLHRAVTAKPVFSEIPADAISIETRSRHADDAPMVGRLPSVAAQPRSAEVAIRGDVQGRAVLRFYNKAMADGYGLTANTYVRRRVMGIDLLASEGDASKRTNAKRLAVFREQERKSGITASSSGEEVLSHRNDYDGELQAQAWEKVSKKFGVADAREVFRSHGITVFDAQD